MKPQCNKGKDSNIEQVDNIYNHKRKEKKLYNFICMESLLLVHLIFNNHCVMTEGKLREEGKGSMSRDLFFNLFFSNTRV